MTLRQRSLRVEAIVLRHTDWGEADRLLTLLTRELGKLRAVGKGVRKERSRKAGHLEPFTRVNLLLARGRDLPLITQAETVENYLPLREDLLLIGYASYVVELIDRSTYEEGENLAMYRLLTETLARLAAKNDPLLAMRYYEIRLLDLLGFRPQLFQCAKCQAEIQAEHQYFSAALGGALCPKCGQSEPGAQPISMTALKTMRHYQRSSYSEAARAYPTPAINREIEAILQHYLTYLLERRLNTPTFLQQIKRTA